MSIMSAVERFAARVSAARNRVYTEQIVRSLPLEIQKDIGWPDALHSGSVSKESGSRAS